MAQFDSSYTAWDAPPLIVASTDDAIDVWLISLTQPGDSYASLTDILSPSEQERAARFKFEVHRRRFVVAHAALHSILSQYLKTPPASLQFVNNANGKPRLTPGLDWSGVKFNLSHSHETALLAVAHNREVGIDIELIKEDYGFEEVAARFFTARELASFRAQPLYRQRQAFFKCWTSKEAFLKAKGTGLSGKLDEVEILLTDDHRVVINASVPGWTLTELNPGGKYEAALVVEGGPLPINCYRWEPTS